MTISIIIPVFRVEAYIRRCLDSVMAQDTSPCDIECILVDDCTPDNSMVIAREMIAEYQGPIRFVCLRHEANRGISAARNTGIDAARGEWVLFMDSDDHLQPKSIQYFTDRLAEHPEADMVVGNVIHGEEGRLIMQDIGEPLFIDDAGEICRRMLRHRIYLHAWNKLIRRSILTDNNVYFFIDLLYEDISWSYRLFAHLTSVLLLPVDTYVYECNPASIVSTTFSAEKADKVVWSYAITSQYLLDVPPRQDRYAQNLTADYLLFVMNWLMKGMDVLTRCSVSDRTARDLREARKRLLARSVGYGRLFIACFCLLLFPPLCHLQRLAVFRHHYYDLESVVNIVSHLTDCLHRRRV